MYFKQLNAGNFKEREDHKEFIRKVAEGLEDYKSDRVHSLEQTFDIIDKIIEVAEDQ